MITVEPHDLVSGQGKSATTPEAWALADGRAAASAAPSIQRFQMPEESQASQAVEFSYDEDTFSPDQQKQHSVAIFWQFGRKLFAAHLNYNARDPNGPALEKVFFETIRSIRANDTGGSRPPGLR